MGIDVGGSSIKWALLDGERVVRDGSLATPATDAAAVLAAIAGLVRGQGAVGAGLALPAVIEGGSTLLAPNLPGDWAGLAVGPPLSAELGIPVTLCNDARAFTRAEWLLGAAQGRRNVIGLTLGTGVGGGLVVDGTLVSGPRGQAGELGHLPVGDNGVRCGCGALGCLETYAGARAIVRDSGLPSAEAVVGAARAGDPAATRTLARAGAAIGRGLAVLATALGTEIVVVGGGLAAALDLLRPAIEAELDRRRAFIGPCPVVASTLGIHAGAIGAALWKEQP